jgi:hypothetical protein
MISLENLCRFKSTAVKLGFPATSKSWVNFGFFAGQLSSGSLVPWRASIVTPHCTKQWQSWRRSALDLDRRRITEAELENSTSRRDKPDFWPPPLSAFTKNALSGFPVSPRLLLAFRLPRLVDKKAMLDS